MGGKILFNKYLSTDHLQGTVVLLRGKDTVSCSPIQQLQAFNMWSNNIVSTNPYYLFFYLIWGKSDWVKLTFSHRKRQALRNNLKQYKL